APEAVEISRERFLQRLERNSRLLERFAVPKSALATPTLLARPGITLLTGNEIPNAEVWLDRIDAEQSRLSRAWQLDPAARNRVELIVHLRLGESENRGLTLPPIDRKSP